MSHLELGAVVLAAGLSRRMGRPKLLDDDAGPGPLSCVMDTLGAVDLAALVVVVSAEAGTAAAGLPPAARRVVFSDPAGGVAGSLRKGVGALPPGLDGAYVVLADMPEVRAGTYAALRAALASAPGVDAAVPWHAGQRGNPVLLRPGLLARVDALRGDTGFGTLLRSQAARVLPVPVEDAGVLADLDTLAALAAWRQRRRLPR